METRVNDKKTCFWRAKDSKTSFKFSGPVWGRSMQNCMKLNKQIKKQCYRHMLEAKNKGKKIKFVADKLAHYKGFAQKVVYAIKMRSSLIRTFSIFRGSR